MLSAVHLRRADRAWERQGARTDVPVVLKRGHVLRCEHGRLYLAGWKFDWGHVKDGLPEADLIAFALTLRPEPFDAGQVPGCPICEALWLY